MGKTILEYERKYSEDYWRKQYEPQIARLQETIQDITSIYNADIINVWRKDTCNHGDINCAPCLYFPELQKNAAFIDISNFPRLVTPRNKCIIVGGGGLFQKYFEEDMQKLYSLAEFNKVIIWGAGLDNYVGAISTLPDMSNITLVGVRDYENGMYSYVPCASCMSGLFDEFRNVEKCHSVKLYLHGDYSEKIINDLSNIPYMQNDSAESFREIIEFMSDAEVILTNSFHGMYWATLLGKKVVVIPWVTTDNKVGYSQKFKTFKYKPVFCDDWKNYADYLNEAVQYPEALAESRGANLAFFEEVKGIIS